MTTDNVALDHCNLEHVIYKLNMYEGKSIIIRNAVALVFLLAALSCSPASLGVVFFLSQLCRFEVARSVPVSQPYVNHGCSTLRLHQGRAAFSDPFFVVCGVSGAEIHRRLLAQYGNSVLP